MQFSPKTVDVVDVIVNSDGGLQFAMQQMLFEVNCNMTNAQATEKARQMDIGTKPPRQSSRIRRLFKVAVAVFVVGLLFDLALRFGLGLGNPILYQYSPEAGYVLRPDQHTWRFFATNSINRWGMRCADFALKRPEGTYRVMFLGDSVTYGTTYVDQSKLFTTRLSKILPSLMHQPVQVLNASCGAWAVGNELGYLKSRGTFDSNLVVLVINTGDLTQPFNWATLAPDHSYPNRPPALAITELWFRYLLPRLQGLEPFRDQGSYVKTISAQQAPNIEKLLGQMQKLCKSRGARLSVVYHPFSGKKWDAAPFPAQLTALKSWCTAKGVAFLDLTKAYAAAPPSEVYYGGVHLKALGNKLAAKAIAADWSNLSRDAAPTTQSSGR